MMVFYTIEQAARALGVDRRQLRRRYQAGRLIEASAHDAEGHPLWLSSLLPILARNLSVTEQGRSDVAHGRDSDGAHDGQHQGGEQEAAEKVTPSAAPRG